MEKLIYNASQSLTVNKLADVAADPDDELHVAMEAGTAVEVGQTVTRARRRRCKNTNDKQHYLVSLMDASDTNIIRVLCNSSACGESVDYRALRSIYNLWLYADNICVRTLKSSWKMDKE